MRSRTSGRIHVAAYSGNRTSALELTLLTFWPPGPLLLANDFSKVVKGIESFRKVVIHDSIFLCFSSSSGVNREKCLSVWDKVGYYCRVRRRNFCVIIHNVMLQLRCCMIDWWKWNEREKSYWHMPVNEKKWYNMVYSHNCFSNIRTTGDSNFNETTSKLKIFSQSLLLHNMTLVVYFHIKYQTSNGICKYILVITIIQSLIELSLRISFSLSDMLFQRLTSQALMSSFMSLNSLYVEKIVNA